MEIAICEDNPLHLYYTQTVLKHSIENDINYNLTVCNNADEFMDIIQKNSLFFDIVLLDIDLGNVSGIEIAKIINCINPLSQIIFITGYINYALDVYDIDHTYFILKNEIEKRLPAAIQRAILNLKTHQVTSLIVKPKGRILSINITDIFYFRTHETNHISCLYR